MKVVVSDTNLEMGRAAGKAAADLIRASITEKGSANIILATGTSQFETINQLIKEDIDWSKVTMFHLDEYIGMPVSHPASFRKYLKERFLDKVSPLKANYLINAEEDAQAEAEALGKLISQHLIDVALVGVGENGHLAFNDPPADFDTEKPYLVVNLDEPCRRQQMGEGWFSSLDEVPKQAISMSVRQIMKSKYIICSVPDERKAQAVKDSLEREVSNLFPASILQQHAHCEFYLDKLSASLLIKAGAF
ncbi:glucosamine-6-phosphate deaminase [Dyadobacter koreensis]|uniref:Glucosamine-6-phosphate deaminase n=1 Tax=Dyadobacter koreensis TaxID=408657 RepID=A0A1H6Q4J1_9BACT|nr:glucosamine-6-phosphate deaminase [Dyadobacter koreensis]SEI38713.1 glucosamine-6-phosphate deaminase [Dyadobacter koreensis]